MDAFIPFPAIDPVLVTIPLGFTELAIRWYALAYIAGLLIGWRYVARLMARPALWGGTAPMRPDETDDLLTWMILGVILGGRLGYVLFYQPGYYAANPGEILAVWRGGMSFHGGLLGVIVGVIGFARLRGLEVLRVGDAVAAAAPIGIFFGRVANFINAELWGSPTTRSWGVLFPGEGAVCPPDWAGVCARHPSQLYEAALEGVVLFLVIVWAIRRGALMRPARVMGIFLAGYGVARFLVEFVREPDGQFVTAANPAGHVLAIGEMGVSMGQLLSLPMIFIGLVLILRPRRVAA